MNQYPLEQLADQMMREKGLEPGFTRATLEELARIVVPAQPDAECQDVRSLLWCSIDNDDSLDLDQLTYAEKAHGGGWVIWIAVADVDALVPKGSLIDEHARKNTTSVYTPDKIFPMLPEKLSTNLTSLNEGQDRVALVAKVDVSQAGEIGSSKIVRAVVHNKAKLAYSSVGAWLEEREKIPDKLGQMPELQEALLVQHEAAQALKRRRHQAGALT